MEWPPAGDFILWAIDETGFYGNYCLSLMHTARFDEWTRFRAEHSGPKSTEASAIVDSVTKKEAPRQSEHADIVDEITGRSAGLPKEEDKNKKKDDPLEGTKF